MKTRIYAVNVVIVGSGEDKKVETRDYLVDAASQSAARNHVAKKHIRVDVADGKTVAKLMAGGVKMESAAEEPVTGTQATIAV
jgi:hypothetical protein